jgi:hypothetical protein
VSQKDLVPDFEENLKTLFKCIEHNCTVIDLIINNSDSVFENQPTEHEVDPSVSYGRFKSA